MNIHGIMDSPVEWPFNCKQRMTCDMKSCYRFEADHLVESGVDTASVIIYCQPSDSEKEDLLRETMLDAADLDAIYDPDELPRLVSTEGGILLIWKRPDNVTKGHTVQFEVSSLGIVIGPKRAVLIVPKGEIPVVGREFKKIQTIQDYVLRVLLSTVHHYQGHLKAIRMISQEIQAKLITSMGNRYLLQMFALTESLVYYYNALEANLAVLSKLRSVPDKMGLNADQIGLLDDLIVESQQSGKQAEIYSTVLSGLMDARGTIINNNMNVLLKNLTIINVVFMPLNLIAGIGGMSEFSMMTHGVDWRVAYLLFSVAMLVLGLVTWWWLSKAVDPSHNNIGRRGRR